ncbi:TIGR02588 family protein [Pleurocapsa sp. CCALA 161]|uniref:TIGR02588 family protein n=1 Tax=Pleurocapsa sp. CCALA 161 TaxID=2107688 RepID=UPI000D048A18|nr:TIGR02588 family protein [Pleurocapsa sp. CCALA 161]PSB06283.1 TIGR02588 family protein [Pleurocapsa sp. CCALA 161]
MSKNSPRRSLAEKVSLSISLFLVSIIVALICYTWITGDTNPPILSISTEKTREVNQQYYVPFTITNSGGKTATSVEITAELVTSETTQFGRQEIDFLSRQETQSGEFIFNQDPEAGELKVRVASYQEP